VNRISVGNFYIRIRIDKTAYWNYTQVKYSYFNKQIGTECLYQLVEPYYMEGFEWF